MMETTDLWNGSHFAHCWRLYAARLGRVLLKLVLALFTVGDVYASLRKRGTYAPFSAQRRSRALFWL